MSEPFSRIPADARCVICHAPIWVSSPFEASKPRRGRTIYAHTSCLEKEQAEFREAVANDQAGKGN